LGKLEAEQQLLYAVPIPSAKTMQQFSELGSQWQQPNEMNRLSR